MFDDVVGSLSETDKTALMGLSLLCSTLDGDYLEIGSYQGLSTLHILHHMPAHKTLYAVDPQGRERQEILRGNLERHGCLEHVRLVNKKYQDCESELPSDLKLAFVFVDNNHTYDDTRIPREMFWERLSAGGFMTFHDYANPGYPGVEQYLEEFSQHAECRVLGQMGGVFGIRKQESY